MKQRILLGLISAFANCSETDAMREFNKLGSSLHERLPFKTQKLPSSASDVFKGEAYVSANRLSMVCAFPDSGKIAVAVQIEQEKKESPIFLSIQQGVSNLSNLKNTLGEAYSRLKFVSISYSVEELDEACFDGCRSLSRVTLGPRSSLKHTGRQTFRESSLRAIHIPDSVEELCDKCFEWCESRSPFRITFGETSCLKRIGKNVFYWSDLHEIHIPDSVEEICDACFIYCEALASVTFGESSSLKLIGWQAFCCSGLREIHLPDSVEKLSDRCFYLCKSLSRVTFGEAPSLKRIGGSAFAETDLHEIHLPNSLREVYDNAFVNTNSSNVNIGKSTIWSVNSLPYIAGCGYKYAIVWNLESKNGENSWVPRITNECPESFPIPPQIMQLADQSHED